MLPQFARDSIYKISHSHIAIGISIFSIGLFKKVVFADTAALYATPIFNAAELGVQLTFFESWAGALAYTFQLYFDFSGYSDMAIGIARMFGILLPLNFHSPYKANNIVDFWRRWHITLSRFLRDYLYITLGGSRKGNIRRYINLFLTMLLGGLWHGAGWTFVTWGGLHGVYLMINHGWRALKNHLGIGRALPQSFSWVPSRIATFIAVVVAWVFFRAESFSGAMEIIASMSGANGLSLPDQLSGRIGSAQGILENAGVTLDGATIIPIGRWLLGIPLLMVMFLISWFAPNTQQIMSHFRPAYKAFDDSHKRTVLQWKPNFLWSFITALVTLFAVIGLFINQASEFLYFNF